jgi:hypothetical protein
LVLIENCRQPLPIAVTGRDRGHRRHDPGSATIHGQVHLVLQAGLLTRSVADQCGIRVSAANHERTHERD